MPPSFHQAVKDALIREAVYSNSTVFDELNKMAPFEINAKTASIVNRGAQSLVFDHDRKEVHQVFPPSTGFGKHWDFETGDAGEYERMLKRHGTYASKPNIVQEAASEDEAFDKFDELYLKNHKDVIQQLVDSPPRGMIRPQAVADKNSISVEKAEEIIQFWSMHQTQIADRLSIKSEGTINENRRGYGGWLSPSGKEIPVLTRQDHEPVAQKILGDTWEELRGQGLEASEILGKRGWARLVHLPDQTLVDMDTNSRITHQQRSYLNDLGIENDVNVILDTGRSERYLYQREHD